jgi:uncharacterized phiE125 gp8 family phage protein
VAMFELEPVALASGDDVLSLALAKAQVRLVDDDDFEDELIALFRDAAIDLVEKFTMKKLRPTEMVWRGVFPGSGKPLVLGVGPITDVTAIGYTDSNGAAQMMAVGDVAIGTHRRVLPAAGKDWPTDVSGIDGSVTIEFEAGYALGAVPTPLLQAAQFMIGHFYRHREQVVTGSITAEVPFAFTHLCNAYRDPVIG